ncbi:hypothetical protein THS5294_01318 [Thalassobacter stenotrophicus]|jgi:hypothetical protein|uniref:Uncharacterized protein n=2 Tax=Thalassobacter stenotrophicus TaxID=266809 RepID=A0A0P1EYF5_9RHOB|nr:hypothetical protein THS5294_01318 [Thalassobacter stenotrophicus]SHJ38463.1 hypothetical protein SAMN02744035_03575 [Thalassobacter stenotrophicus DSM 16310]
MKIPKTYFVAQILRFVPVPITHEVNILKVWHVVWTFRSARKAQVPNE